MRWIFYFKTKRNRFLVAFSLYFLAKRRIDKKKQKWMKIINRQRLAIFKTFKRRRRRPFRVSFHLNALKSLIIDCNNNKIFDTVCYSRLIIAIIDDEGNQSWRWWWICAIVHSKQYQSRRRDREDVQLNCERQFVVFRFLIDHAAQQGIYT